MKIARTPRLPPWKGPGNEMHHAHQRPFYNKPITGEYAMSQPLQNYPSVASAGSANELPVFPLISFNGSAANGSLPAYRDAFAGGVMLQPGSCAGFGYWAARMIAVTRDDWVKHGCCLRKKEKRATPATKPNPVPQPDTATAGNYFAGNEINRPARAYAAGSGSWQG